MILGIIKKQDNSYEYFNMIDNQIQCLHVDNNGFSLSDLTEIRKLFSKKVIHFDNYNSYNSSLFSSRRHSIKKVMSSIIILSSAMILEIGSYGMMFSFGERNNNYENVNSFDILTYDSAIKCINESSLNSDAKILLANEQLLKDIFNYYEDTPLAYIANLKFNNINIKYYDDDDEIDERYKSNGFYQSNIPNILFVNDEYASANLELNKNARQTVAHEFIHLLEAPANPYTYLKEAAAELLVKEYYNMSVVTYKPAVKQLMLLIDIIGPDPIMKLLFSGDNKLFLKTITTYLNDEDSQLLINYFKNGDLVLDHPKENYHIQEILCKLYKNMYGQDISNDENILYDIVYNNDNYDCVDTEKYYLNMNKMLDQDEYKFFNVDINKLKNLSFLQEQLLYEYERRITYDEYEQLLKSNNSYNFYFFGDGKHGGIVVDNDELKFYEYDVPNKENGNLYAVDLSRTGKNISILQAISFGYISDIYVKQTSKELLINVDWNLVNVYKKYNLVNNKGLLYILDERNNYLVVRTDSVKKRFKSDLSKEKSLKK